MDTRLVWLALGGFVGASEGFLIGSLLPSIAEDFSVSVGQASVVVLGYSLTNAVGTPVLSAVFGNADRRILVAWAEAGFCLLCLAIAFSPSLLTLALTRLTLSLAAGVFTANAVAIAATISAEERRGRAIGFVTSGQSVALILGIPLFAYIAAHYGWRFDYLIISGLALLSVIGLRFGLPANIPNVRLSLGERLAVLRMGGVRTALLATFVHMLGTYSTLIFVGPMLTAAAGDRSALPVVLLANGVGAVLGSNLGGRAADRFGAKRVTLVLCGSQAVALLAAAYATSTGHLFGMPLLAASLFLSGASGWGFWPAQSAQIAMQAKASANLAIALNFSALNLGVAGLALAGGIVIERFGPTTLAQAAAVCVLLSAVILSTLRESQARGATSS